MVPLLVLLCCVGVMCYVAELRCFGRLFRALSLSLVLRIDESIGEKEKEQATRIPRLIAVQAFRVPLTQRSDQVRAESR